MSCDIVQHPFADKLLKKVNILVAFFKNNAKAGAKFRKLLNTMNIKGGVIVPYCKTRWTTAYRSIDDTLRVKVILENLSNKRRLKLGVERLESMLKLITYYRSNASHEFAFYGKGTKRNSQKFSDSELNTIINEALAERSELEEDDDEIALDVSQDILNGLENVREFPEEEGEEANDNVDGNNQNDNEVAGRGILYYNVDDLAKEFED
ncbi:hypothetical protein C1646_773699 [Rhizophagus diaphanus]|nr:hypothetical protein C1646_773699 [Rhizophagus diaphanus] [Rhizophagus sp. MUCL 43196]